MVIDEAFDAGCNVLARVARQLFVGKQDDARTHDVLAARKARNRIADPPDEAVGADRQIAVACSMEARGACLEFQGKRLLRCRLDRLGVRSVGTRNWGKPEPGQLPHMMSFNKDIAIHTDFSFQHRILSQALHEHRCPAINKAFRQPFM